jgi:hypothetical protein
MTDDELELLDDVNDATVELLEEDRAAVELELELLEVNETAVEDELELESEDDDDDELSSAIVPVIAA